MIGFVHWIQFNLLYPVAMLQTLFLLGGSPRVAFFHAPQNRVEFFASFGRKPCKFRFSFQNSLQNIHNTFLIQAKLTAVCGHFCIRILNHRALIYTLHSIAKKFSTVPFARSASIFSSFIQRFLEWIKKVMDVYIRNTWSNRGFFHAGQVANEGDLCLFVRNFPYIE